ncbi:MAG: tetratricopeptide repeat protein [Rickettsiales bacterium]
MRFLSLMTVLALLASCDFPSTGETKTAVDPNHLPPLTGREQSLLVGAQGALAQGNVDAAERDYLTAVGASTGHVEAHLALARLYATQNQLEKQREVLLKALGLQPNHPELNYRLGKLELAQDNYAQALEAFKRGIVGEPNNIDLLSGAGVASDMLGDHAQAQRYYTRAIAQNPGADLSGARTNLGMSYLLSEEPKRAVDVLKDEAKKPVASETTRHNLALAYGVLGRNTEAKALVKGELDEETRLLSVARLREYWNDRSPEKNPLRPGIHDTPKTVAATPIVKTKNK